MKRSPTLPGWQEYFAQQATACKTPALQKFYAAGLPDDDTPISEVPLIALDFETTGMDPRKHDIVSIGMVPFNLRIIRPARGHYWVVKPSESLREESVTFHRITHSEVQGAPSFDAVLDDILEQLTGHLIVVHYRNIERSFLDAAVIARRGEHCLFPMIDTMELEARRERQGYWQRFRHFFGSQPTSIRLANSRHRYGLPDYSSHHAKVDAMATAELFQAQVARHFSPETPVSELWV
ncbi:3'-5' exonuclease [Thiohalophilus sp.]|uniref:3'-5' exonuclease n=1 Tax=Thiohalophilus sp. TaxID=3028392 RepID=UPI003976AC43